MAILFIPLFQFRFAGLARRKFLFLSLRLLSSIDGGKAKQRIQRNDDEKDDESDDEDENDG